MLQGVLLAAALFLPICSAFADETSKASPDEFRTQKQLEEAYLRTREAHDQRLKLMYDSQSGKLEADYNLLSGRKGKTLPQVDHCQKIGNKDFSNQTKCDLKDAKQKLTFEYHKQKENVSGLFSGIVQSVSSFYDQAKHKILNQSPQKLSNLPPTAGTGILYQLRSSGTRPEVHFFTQWSISDPDGWVTTVKWEFGDGTSMTIPKYELDNWGFIIHYFPTTGTYPVKLTLTDNLGATTEFNTTVVINDNGIPQPNFTFTQNSGNSISFEGFANDPENSGRRTR